MGASVQKPLGFELPGRYVSSRSGGAFASPASVEDPMAPEKAAPIACTLGSGELTARLGGIAALNTRFLRDHRIHDLQLELHYDGQAREQVLQRVRAEQACCAFLTFEARDEPGAVRVLIRAPEAACAAAATVFEHFLRKVPAPPSGKSGDAT